MKILFKYFLKTLKWLLFIIVFYFLNAVLFSFLSTHPKKLNCNKDKEIFITTNGLHLEIIIPENLINPTLKENIYTKAGVKYISFAWGDKAFYLNTPTWKELKFPTAIKALFLKSESAIHLTNYFQQHDKWKKLLICEEQLNLLTKYIDGAFKKLATGERIEIENSGYSAHDTFYEAEGSYSCFRTCNNWVNIALKKSDIKTSIWSPFDFGVLYHID